MACRPSLAASYGRSGCSHKVRRLAASACGSGGSHHGLIVTVAILGIVWQSSKAVFTRLLDGAEPGVVAGIAHAAEHVGTVRRVSDVRARWLGHRLITEQDVAVAEGITALEAEATSAEVKAVLTDHVPALARAHVRVRPVDSFAAPAKTGHHHAPDPVPVRGKLAQGVLGTIDTAAGERTRFQVSALAADATVPVMSDLGEGYEKLTLLPAADAAHLLLGAAALAEPHEFDVGLLMKVAGCKGSLAFRVTEPAGHAHQVSDCQSIDQKFGVGPSSRPQGRSNIQSSGAAVTLVPLVGQFGVVL